MASNKGKAGSSANSAGSSGQKKEQAQAGKQNDGKNQSSKRS